MPSIKEFYQILEYWSLGRDLSVLLELRLDESQEPRADCLEPRTPLTCPWFGV